MLGRVLFVCVGNICRSPMAEALYRARGRGRPDAEAASAGIAAVAGRPADPIAVALMADRGIDLSGHRARPLTGELIAAHDLVLVMEDGHKREIESIYPQSRGRVHRLGRFGGFDVPDPYRGTRAEFEQALALIERGLDDYRRAVWGAA